MKNTKKKKSTIIDNGVNVAPCKMYRFRVKFKDPSAKDLISPPYAFAGDKDAMKWVNDTAVRLLDDIKATYVSIGCHCFGECDACGKLTFSDEKLIGTVTRNHVLSAMILKLEGYKNA